MLTSFPLQRCELSLELGVLLLSVLRRAALEEEASDETEYEPDTGVDEISPHVNIRSFVLLMMVRPNSRAFCLLVQSYSPAPCSTAVTGPEGAQADQITASHGRSLTPVPVGECELNGVEECPQDARLIGARPSRNSAGVLSCAHLRTRLASSSGTMPPSSHQSCSYLERRNRWVVMTYPVSTPRWISLIFETIVSFLSDIEPSHRCGRSGARITMHERASSSMSVESPAIRTARPAMLITSVSAMSDDIAPPAQRRWNSATATRASST